MLCSWIPFVCQGYSNVRTKSAQTVAFRGQAWSAPSRADSCRQELNFERCFVLGSHLFVKDTAKSRPGLSLYLWTTVLVGPVLSCPTSPVAATLFPSVFYVSSFKFLILYEQLNILCKRSRICAFFLYRNAYWCTLTILLCCHIICIKYGGKVLENPPNLNFWVLHSHSADR
jgi:hypothetical protein